MKSTDAFKLAIKSHLDQLAQTDELFAKTYQKENKSLDECVKYIIQTVKKSGIVAYAEGEIYGMAVHYYDEDDIKAEGVTPNCNIVSPRTAELTEEEIKEAKQKAIDQVISEQREKILHKPEKPARKKEEATVENPLTLF